MSKFPAFILAGVAAAAVAGSAVAASRTHVMDVPLSDGSVAHIEYVGDVAPKVTIAPAPFARFGANWVPMALPSMPNLDRMMKEMQRRSAELVRQSQILAKQPWGAYAGMPNMASFGNLPAGETSTTVVSISNNGSTCTRTTEVVSQGAGKAPKVTSNVSGTCGTSAAPPASKGVNPT